MQLISKFNEEIRFLFCAIYIFDKSAWVTSWKDKKDIAIPDGFQKILNESRRKPNKVSVDKGSEFCNRSMKSCLKINGIETYSTHFEGKSVIAEKFIRTLRNKIYKSMTSILKYVYIDKLGYIVHKDNNIYITQLTWNLLRLRIVYILTLVKKSNDNDHKFKVGDNVIISKYKNIFAEGCSPNLSEKVFLI